MPKLLKKSRVKAREILLDLSKEIITNHRKDNMNFFALQSLRDY